MDDCTDIAELCRGASLHNKILKVKVSRSVVSDFATPWTVALQAPLSTEFSRQESWSALPFPCPWDLADPGIEPESPALQADSLWFAPPGKPYSVQFSRSVVSESLRPHESQHASPPCPSPTPGVHSDSCPSSQ